MFTVYAWLRLSDTLTDGYFAVRGAAELDGDGPILAETKLVGSAPDSLECQDTSYTQYEVTFASGDLRRVLIYVGLWGVGPDAWIQIDDFGIWRYSLEDDHTPGSKT